MKWTEDQPAETGYYWHIYDQRGEQPGVVYVSVRDGVAFCRTAAGPLRVSRMSPGKWAGPIPLPTGDKR